MCSCIQVLEILSHVNKRVRGHDQIKLPLDALLDLYLSDSSAPLVKNFAVVYVEMAMDRSLQDQQTTAVYFLPFCSSPLCRDICISCGHECLLLYCKLSSLRYPHESETDTRSPLRSGSRDCLLNLAYSVSMKQITCHLSGMPSTPCS